uniref:Protein kintoun n=1 Tax=Anthurium amnicola TaxID=1678845 RepID=A0A1D1XYV9_9ARAE
MDAIVSFLPRHASCAPLPPSPSPNPHFFFLRNEHILAPPSPPAKPRLSMATLNRGRCQHRLRASSAEVPSEIIEDSKFTPLNADDPIYGPPALLLVGFDANETTKIHQLLKDLDGEFLKVIHCTEDMISLTVWDAMHMQQQNVETLKKAKSRPRICILSGLSGEETMMFIDAFPEAAGPPPYRLTGERHSC